MIFATALAARSEAGPVVITADRSLDLAQAQALCPAPDIPRRVALSIGDVATLVQTLAALDGAVEALLLISSALPAEPAQALCTAAGCEWLISDRDDLDGAIPPDQALNKGEVARRVRTQWIMTTSGTTGMPKMVVHHLDSLTRSLRRRKPGAAQPVWGLSYEATRFAGLQVVLQAVLGDGVLVAPDLSLDLPQRIALLARHQVSHMSATPTLWRSILMHPAARTLPLRQITLGGEIADQPVLEALRARFPEARLTHIYASTEAGVGFSVQDGREGFPAGYLAEGPGGVDLKIAENRLWIRPPGPRTAYLGDQVLTYDADGYVDTQDVVRQDGDRVLFAGRDSGMVSVGGTKVFPEEVERVINALPGVAMARVSAKRNPFSGAILVAMLVPEEEPADPDAFKSEIIRQCRARLPKEAAPAMVQLVTGFDINAAGKLQRG